MEDKIFKQDAKQIVDMAFDGKLLKENVTRDDMNVFEELIHFLLKTRFESYQRCEELLKRIENNSTNKN